MTLKTIAGVALALTLLTGTAAALPGAAPAQAEDHANGASDAGDEDRDAADSANEAAGDANAADDHANEPADGVNADDHANETADGVTAADAPANDAASQAPDEADRGPPSDMPAPVPDFVGGIHGAINDFLAGDGEGSLGDTISDLTPGDEAAGATETATPA